MAATYCYTAPDIEAMRAEAKAAHCTAPHLFWSTPPEELRSVCNGIGAEDAPRWTREALTWAYRRIAAAGAIHDCRYELSDGTEDNRGDADREFYENARLLLAHRYGVCRWLRPSYRHDRRMAYAAYLALIWLGYAAWQAAYQRRAEHDECL